MWTICSIERLDHISHRGIEDSLDVLFNFKLFNLTRFFISTDNFFISVLDKSRYCKETKLEISNGNSTILVFDKLNTLGLGINWKKPLLIIFKSVLKSRRSVERLGHVGDLVNFSIRLPISEILSMDVHLTNSGAWGGGCGVGQRHLSLAMVLFKSEKINE